MEEYHHQLYRRPQMTGQAREEEGLGWMKSPGSFLCFLLSTVYFMFDRLPILLQPVLSCTSSFVVPMALMSRLTKFIHLRFSLPHLLLAAGTISSVFRHIFGLVSGPGFFTCQNHLSLAFLHLSVIFSTFSLSLMSSFLTLFSSCVGMPLDYTSSYLSLPVSSLGVFSSFHYAIF